MTRWLAATLGLVAGLSACRKSSPPQSEQPSIVQEAQQVPKTLPTALAIGDYLGADACAECHRTVYDAWARSPHGRSMALPSRDTVLADFDGGSITLPDGTVSFSRQDDAYYMDLQSSRGMERRKVDLVLASGRQHQLYAVRAPDGTASLLPVVWSTKTRGWLPLSLYQPSDLSPDSPTYWASRDMTRGCTTCHLSQAYRRIESDHTVRNAWVDLSINCESCHGPGREHVRRRGAGEQDDTYRDLRSLGSVEESRICGQCHGFQLKRYVFPPGDDGLPQIFVTSLINQSLRADGTQHLTSYQYPGHVLSAGFAQKILTCKDCHAPHGLEARGHDGSSAVGDESNRQCTACHEQLVNAVKVRAHTHHDPSRARCVDCHMAYSWIGDDDRRHQRTSDHSISIPHPRETIELGTPNACTTCHGDRTAEWALAALVRWKASDATGVRRWVETIALGRKKAPGATARLVELLTTADTGKYLKLSALDLLAVQAPDPSVAAAVSSYTTDPDPGLRASAIRALDVHDPAGRQRWRALGLADPHPYVRMETFSLVDDVEHLPAAAIDRQLEDVMAYMSPPNDGLVHLITVRHRRGELREALQLVDRLEHVALSRERRSLDLDAVRARIMGDLAKGAR